MGHIKILAAVVILAIAIHTIHAQGQENKTDPENPPSSEVAKKPNNETPAPEAKMVDSQTPEAKPTGDETAPKKSPKSPPKRPGRRRRPGKRRRQRKRKPGPTASVKSNDNRGGRVNIPEVNIDPDLKPNAQAVVQPETMPDTTNGKSNPKPAAVKQMQKPKTKSADTDPFFDMFMETTTAEPDPNKPPPDFSVNVPPRKKVMPKLGPNKNAHDGTPCNETYKAHETIKTKYMMKYADGVWETLNCPPNLGTGLVWREDLCACGDELIPQDPDDWCAGTGHNPHPQNKNKYTRRIHGVDALMDCPGNLIWSQKTCQCIFDPAMRERPIENSVSFTCKTILKMEFEGDLKNSALGYQVEPVKLRRRGRLPRIRFGKVPGSTNKAAMIVSQPLEFLAFRGNDFQRKVTYSLAFKISPRHLTRSNAMVLISDECKGSLGQQRRNRKPSIALSFVPNTKTFRLLFRTERAEVDQLIEGAQPDINGWYKVVVYFEDQTLNLESGGKLLFQQKVEGKIPQNKCPLYIAGRGPGYDRSMDFYGYLDSVTLVKDCKFHEANIKFL